MKQFWYMATFDPTYWLWRGFFNGDDCWISQGSIALTNEIKLSTRKMCTEFWEIFPGDEFGIKSGRAIPVEVAGGYLTPCVSPRAAVNLNNLQATDSDFGRMISEIISLVSLILSLTPVYVPSLTAPMDRIYVCVQISDCSFLFSPSSPQKTLFWEHLLAPSEMSSISGKVQTVLGPVEPSQLGRTLTHEHLTMTFDCSYYPPPPSHEVISKEPIRMKNLFWIQKNPYSHKENLQLNQETEAIKEELLDFKANGGGALVENTTTGISRDVQTLKRLAEETGVHIISGAGFYVDATHSSETRAMSVEQVKSPQLLGHVCLCKFRRVRTSDLGLSPRAIHIGKCLWLRGTL